MTLGMFNHHIFMFLPLLLCILPPLLVETNGFGIFPETLPILANAPYNASGPLKSVGFNLGGRGLAQRQSCPPQYSPCRFNSSQCCPTGGICCRWDSDIGGVILISWLFKNSLIQSIIYRLLSPRVSMSASDRAGR